ncbi:MAG: hypothetical protein QM775_23650 [Pirellulales bacterium]
MLGVFVTVAALGFVSSGGTAHADAMSTWQPGVGTDLITSVHPTADNRQLITMIDPRTRVLAVYMIDGATGEVSLKSVRAFQWDLQLAEFNGTSPLPREIRSLVEQHR